MPIPDRRGVLHFASELRDSIAELCRKEGIAQSLYYVSIRPRPQGA